MHDASTAAGEPLGLLLLLHGGNLRRLSIHHARYYSTPLVTRIGFELWIRKSGLHHCNVLLVL